MIFDNFENVLVLLGQLQNFQKCTRAIYPKLPSQTCDYLYKLSRSPKLHIYQSVSLIRYTRVALFYATRSSNGLTMNLAVSLDWLTYIKYLPNNCPQLSYKSLFKYQNKSTMKLETMGIEVCKLRLVSCKYFSEYASATQKILVKNLPEIIPYLAASSISKFSKQIIWLWQ